MFDGIHELVANVSGCIWLSAIVPLLHDILLASHSNDIESNIYIRKIELDNRYLTNITCLILPGQSPSPKRNLQRYRVRQSSRPPSA